MTLSKEAIELLQMNYEEVKQSLHDPEGILVRKMTLVRLGIPIKAQEMIINHINWTRFYMRPLWSMGYISNSVADKDILAAYDAIKPEFVVRQFDKDLEELLKSD
jgi:hypothetical protein